MDPREIQFTSLRKRILSEGETTEDTFTRLRRMNPEMFLKADKAEAPERIKKERENLKAVETMDTKTHHKYSFIPNR